MSGGPCYLLDLGRMPYAEALRIQERLVDLRLLDKIPDVLVLVEHPPVITLGRKIHHEIDEHLRNSREEIEARGIEVYEIGRGGHATFHGPGQLVGYPIVELGGKTELAGYMETLWKVMLAAVEHYGIAARIKQGVWVEDAKIGATGVELVSRDGKHVTMHGFALNINTDLSAFDYIIPCGMPDKKPTSLEQLLGRKVPIEEVSHILAESFKEEFRYHTMQDITLQEIDSETIIHPI